MFWLGASVGWSHAAVGTGPLVPWTLSRYGDLVTRIPNQGRRHFVHGYRPAPAKVVIAATVMRISNTSSASAQIVIFSL